MSDDTMCWFCKRKPATEANGWCAGCTRALDGVVLVPNNITDAALVDSLREQVETLTAERDELAEERQQFVTGLRIAEERSTTAEDDATALRARVAELEKERDAAQQRAKALEQSVRRVTRDALETLAKMPTPTKAHKELAALQRNLFLRVREEIDAAMAAATTKEEAP